MPDAEELPEGARDPVAREFIVWAFRLLYWIFYPVGTAVYYVFYYVSFGLLFAVKLIYEPLAFILSPALYLGQFVFTCLAAPFKFVAKFEVCKTTYQL